MKISLKNQIFGGHKKALSLELEKPIYLNRVMKMTMVSINEGSGNQRVEHMERKIKAVVDHTAINRDDNKVTLYIIKEKTKIFFEVTKKALV